MYYDKLYSSIYTGETYILESETIGSCVMFYIVTRSPPVMYFTVYIVCGTLHSYHVSILLYTAPSKYGYVLQFTLSRSLCIVVYSVKIFLCMYCGVKVENTEFCCVM